MRVLLVEDERKIADFIRKGLTEHGYAVDVPHTGRGDGPGTRPQVRPADHEAAAPEEEAPPESDSDGGSSVRVPWATGTVRMRER